MRPIDADAIADYLDNELLNECFSGKEISAEDAVRMALRKVLNAPTLDVVPAELSSWRGEGDGYYDGEIVYDMWFCGKCDYCIETDDPDELPKFCPNCGVKMRVNV